MSGLFSKGSYMNSTTSFMQFKIKETSGDNKASIGFSEDGSTLIVVNQIGTYYEAEITKGEQQSAKCKN